MNKNPDVDDYIERAAEFAKPILIKLRTLFHKASPTTEETIKLQFPHFEKNGIVGNIAAFKKHVNLGFWKGHLLNDPNRLLKQVGKTEMALLKIETEDDLPSDKTITAWIKEQIKLNDQNKGATKKKEAGKKKAAKKSAAKPKRKKSVELPVPDYLQAKLDDNPGAAETFQNFSPSKRKDYIEWLVDAKQEKTRTKRLATTIEWLLEGKSRNWKYE
jgi:uncharacterized protein YdeI (YjbR/CyaY-like superfamily)